MKKALFILFFGMIVVFSQGQFLLKTDTVSIDSVNSQVVYEIEKIYFNNDSLSNNLICTLYSDRVELLAIVKKHYSYSGIIIQNKGQEFRAIRFSKKEYPILYGSITNTQLINLFRNAVQNNDTL